MFKLFNPFASVQTNNVHGAKLDDYHVASIPDTIQKQILKLSSSRFDPKNAIHNKNADFALDKIDSLRQYLPNSKNFDTQPLYSKKRLAIAHQPVKRTNLDQNEPTNTQERDRLEAGGRGRNVGENTIVSINDALPISVDTIGVLVVGYALMGAKNALILGAIHQVVHSATTKSKNWDHVRN